MSTNLKKFSIAAVLTSSLLAIPTLAAADINCPDGWAKEKHGVAEVCVAQSQFQTQLQTQAQSQNQNNNQSQNNNQNVNVSGGNSSSSSSSSSNITINATPSPTTTTIYVPQVVYTAQYRGTVLPKTGPAETALALAFLLPLGFVLKKYAFKNHGKKLISLPASIWQKKNSL